jgi:hypothetical protein
VPAKRRIDPAEGRAALNAWPTAGAAGPVPPRHVVATAVRYTLEELAAAAPGNSVEVRVPPFGATQCVPGPRHTRGTPPNVVEMVPEVWLALVLGDLTWDDAVAQHRLAASGQRADLSHQLPLFDRRRSWSRE